MTKRKPVITIPIDDWDEQYIQDEPDVTTDDAIIARLLEGITTAQVARHTIVARERGDAPENILKPNKLLLFTGAQKQVSEKYQRRTRVVEVPSGKSYEVREYSAPVREKQEDDEAGTLTDEATISIIAPLVSIDDKDQSVSNAERYLLNVAMGHIWPRLVEIAYHGGDVEEIVKIIKQRLDDMCNKLVG